MPRHTFRMTIECYHLMESSLHGMHSIKIFPTLASVGEYHHIEYLLHSPVPVLASYRTKKAAQSSVCRSTGRDRLHHVRPRGKLQCHSDNAGKVL
jgi:hypothetical protein